jgi:hypothetical protein
MLALYLATLGFGCSLIVVSLLLGGAEKSFDKELSFDKSLSLEDKSFDKAPDSPVVWTPFLSMRFWTFGAMSFGLAGTLLTLMGVPAMLVLMVAMVAGSGMGIAAAWFFRALKGEEVSGDTSFERYTGEEARVVVGIRSDQPGKIAVHTLAGRVEMPATTRDVHPIAAGSVVIVASVRDGVADVSQLPTMGLATRRKAQENRAPQGHDPT